MNDRCAPPLLGIHHVALICSDYERSKAFYTSVLGCSVIAETYRAERQSYKLDLQVTSGGSGMMRLELFSFPDAPPRPSWPEACGLRHLALACDDVEGFRNHVQHCGVQAEDIRTDVLTGKHFFFFSDPDGLPIEIYQR